MVVMKLTQTAGDQKTLAPFVQYGLGTPEYSISKSQNENSPLFQPSFTPWAKEKFTNPEQFVVDYFSAINSRDYNRSWAMLSKNFQQNCCNIGGNDPFSVYEKYWENIKKVEVESAYIQEWDKNPARLIVSLRYYFMEGNTIESINNFWIISDPGKATLLIDEVR